MFSITRAVAYENFADDAGRVPVELDVAFFDVPLRTTITAEPCGEFIAVYSDQLHAVRRGTFEEAALDAVVESLRFGNAYERLYWKVDELLRATLDTQIESLDEE